MDTTIVTSQLQTPVAHTVTAYNIYSWQETIDADKILIRVFVLHGVSRKENEIGKNPSLPEDIGPGPQRHRTSGT
jgi:hypothetical protein